MDFKKIPAKIPWNIHAYLTEWNAIVIKGKINGKIEKKSWKSILEICELRKNKICDKTPGSINKGRSSWTSTW